MLLRIGNILFGLVWFGSLKEQFGSAQFTYRREAALLFNKLRGDDNILLGLVWFTYVLAGPRFKFSLVWSSLISRLQIESTNCNAIIFPQIQVNGRTS